MQAASNHIYRGDACQTYSVFCLLFSTPGRRARTVARTLRCTNTGEPEYRTRAVMTPTNPVWGAPFNLSRRLVVLSVALSFTCSWVRKKPLHVEFRKPRYDPPWFHMESKFRLPRVPAALLTGKGHRRALILGAGTSGSQTRYSRSCGLRPMATMQSAKWCRGGTLRERERQ